MSIFERLTRLFRGKPSAPQPSMPVAPSAESTGAEPHLAEQNVNSGLPPNGKERREQVRQPAADGMHVLVVDDSPTIVRMLSRMLSQNGYEVSEAEDAETGMEIARNTLPNLIFLDIVLPGMNGFEALRRLRRDELTRAIPIIMISGNELATEQFYAQRIGADDFMKKPFSRSEVFLRIEKLLDNERVPHRKTPPTPAV